MLLLDPDLIAASVDWIIKQPYVKIGKSSGHDYYSYTGWGSSGRLEESRTKKLLAGFH